MAVQTFFLFCQVFWHPLALSNECNSFPLLLDLLAAFFEVTAPLIWQQTIQKLESLSSAYTQVHGANQISGRILWLRFIIKEHRCSQVPRIVLF